VTETPVIPKTVVSKLRVIKGNHPKVSSPIWEIGDGKSAMGDGVEELSPEFGTLNSEF
jgi:hypothetical protein